MLTRLPVVPGSERQLSFTRQVLSVLARNWKNEFAFGWLSLPAPAHDKASHSYILSFYTMHIEGDKGEEGIYVFSMALQDTCPKLLPNGKTQHIAENISYVKTFVEVEYLQEKAITL